MSTTPNRPLSETPNDEPPNDAKRPETGATGRSRRPDSQGNPRGRRTGRFWVMTLGGGVILASLVAVVLIFGQVSGREFAPTHFEVRRFSFTEIPGLGIQITPIRRTAETVGLANFLSTSSLINRPKGVATTWHLIELNRASSASPADAKLLTDLLEHHTPRPLGQGNSYWHQWTTDNRELAAILWPEAQKLAERELYLLIPDLFRIVDRAGQKTPDSVSDSVLPPAAERAEAARAAVRDFLVASYDTLIKDMRAAGRAELAQALLVEVRGDYPDEPRFAP
jgi:hypothetical protein